MKKNSKEKTNNKKTLEVSQIIALFSGFCFAGTLLFSMLIIAYHSIKGIECEMALLTILITTTAASFGVTATTYYNKARYENAHKISKSFLKTKYLILKDIGMMDEEQIKAELSAELNEMDDSLKQEKLKTNQEITYKE